MSHRDHYYNKAKQEGYRARSAYKLKQIDTAADVLPEGGVVVDLGAAPGGWSQVAAEAVGADGAVVGVDLQRIESFGTDAAVEFLRGDITDEDTRTAIAEVGETHGAADGPGGPVDVVLSDMAPEMSGEYELDHARSVHLARQALAVARAVLTPGGDFVAKVFQGRDLESLVEDLEGEFEYVRRLAPDASRDASSEIYLIAKGFITAPIEEGDNVTVEITDEGAEGDGIARVDGYTLFVPETSVGETVPVTVTEAKPRYGFAERS